jgi:hypothetical protein
MFDVALLKLQHLGLHAGLPAHLARKVLPTNTITLLLLFVVALPFSAITLVYFPALTVYPVGGVLVCIGVLWLNYLGAVEYSRLIISLFPILLGAIYNAYLSKPSDPPLPSLYLIELGFALIPLVIFDLSEKGYLFFCLLFCGAVILSFPVTNDWFDTDADSTVLRQGWLGNLTILLAIACELGCVYGLALLNRQSEEQSEHLLKASEDKNKQLEENEQELKTYLGKVEAAQQDEKRRSWVTEGLGQLTAILRNHEDNGQVYDRLLSHLIRYAGANQGGLYLVERENESGPVSIRLQACFAYDRKKHTQKVLSPGEGLVGQCYLEGELILLYDIPQHYVHITSGLGEATPTCLLILPLLVGDSVEGLLEIAGFHRFEKHEIDFFEKAGEHIAAYAQKKRVTDHTTLLLRESMQHAEVLRAQEEEMRQNLEELAATQEEMHRKEQEYLRRIEALQGQLNARG